MVLPLEDDARAALEQTNIGEYKIQAFYDDDLTLADVPVTTDGSITFDASGQIQANGTVFLARDGGDSLVPKSKRDPLAPYGQELAISRQITFGGQTWRVPLGRFRIQAIPKASEYFRRFPERMQLVGWSAQLDLVDRFDVIEADDFLTVTAPVAGNTAWEEIRRLAPMPVIKSLTDSSLPSGLVYTGRGNAITQLMDALGGAPQLTRQGALTARAKDRWLTATVPEFTIEAKVDWEDGMSNALYNSVAVTNPNDATILGVAEITDDADPLRVNGPLGRRSYTNSNPLAISNSVAHSMASTMLARLSTQQSRTVTVTCFPRPDLELGDFGLVRDTATDRTVLGEVSRMVFPMDPTALMTLELIVAETR